MNARTAIPTIQRSGGRLRPGDNLERALYAFARHAASPTAGQPEDIARALWNDDPVTPLVISRAAVGPASTTAPAWAGVLAQQATADFVASLAPQSAAAALISRGIRIDLTNRNSLAIPRRSGTPASLTQAWVPEGGAHAVVQFTLASAILGPMRKLELSAALTREAVTIGGEPVVRLLLRDVLAATLDATMFDAAPGTDARPPGLLNNVTPITATTGGGEGAMYADLEALAAALSANGGSGDIVYVAAQRQAASATLRLGRDKAVTILGTPALPAGSIMAVDAAGFASAFGSDPRIDASTETTVVFEDSTPADIGTAGSPNVVAGGTRSAFQQDLVVIRATLDAAWTMRQPGLVAVVNDATWG